MFRIILLFAFFLLPQFFYAQNHIVSVMRYDQEDGLSHNQIHWVFKDSRGVMWVGTANGINRYDGTTFKQVATINFYYADNDQVLEDGDGDLWLKKNDRDKELIFFNTLTEKVKTFEEKFGPDVPFQKDEFDHGVYLANQTVLFSTTKGQLITYDRHQEFKIREFKKNHLFKITYRLGAAHYWVYTCPISQGAAIQEMYLFNFVEGTEKRIAVPPLDINNYFSSTTSEDGLLVRESTGAILELDLNGNTKQEKLPKRDDKGSLIDYSTLHYDPGQDRLLVSDKQRLIIIPRGDTSQLYFSESFRELEVTNLFSGLVEEDRYWMSTIDGLLKVQIRATPFNRILYQNPKTTSQAHFISCRNIERDEDGVFYVETVTVRENFPKSVIEKDSILILLDSGKKMPTSFNASGGKNAPSWAFYKDENERTWVSNFYGLYYIKKGETLLRPFKQWNEFEEFSKAKNYAFYKDQQDQVWMTSNNGLFRLDIHQGIVERYSTEGGPNHYLPSNYLRHMHQDKAGIYWIASKEGLIRWDKANQTHRLFTIKDGFSHNHIYAVYEDDYGYLWMSSDNGIMQFEKSTEKVKIYLPSDGITHREFNRTSHYKDKAGNIYFGGLNGVTYFHPKDFVERINEQPDIPLVLTECHLFSAKTKQQENRMVDFLQKKKIDMMPGDRYLQLQFALLDYSNSNTIQYVYDLDGDQWNLGKEKRISISALSYGDHLLTIKGRTGSGLFSKQSLVIPITVFKPFYLQWWFIALAILTLVVLLFVYQKMKTKALIKRQEELERTVATRTDTIRAQAEELRQLDNAKSRFLANISHEFRTPLTLILNTLDQEAMTKIQAVDSAASGKFFSSTEVNIMHRNACRLQQLIDQLLDLSKLKAGKMTLRASCADFQDYLMALVLSFKPLAEKKQLSLHFETKLSDCPLYFDRDKSDKIIYNLLSNAIKFTPEKGTVFVSLTSDQEYAIVKVKDTGIGIPEASIPYLFDRFYQVTRSDAYTFEGTGLGLSLVKELTEMHGGKVEVSSQIGEGTCFYVYLPLGDQHLQASEKVAVPDPLPIQQPLSPIAPSENTDLLSEESDKPLLLVIEDNEDLLYHHKKAFRSTYQLLLAKDGMEGLKMAFEYIPDLIICDVMMPGKNGYEVCQQLKLDERSNHIPVILLTAKVSHEEKMDGLMVGADDYMTKPYSQKELAVKMHNLLEQQRRLQEKLTTNLENEVEEQIPKTAQQLFIDKCTRIIESNLNNLGFGVEELSREVGMSRTQLFRKIKSITGDSPTHFIRSFRLTKARQLLLNSEQNASEVAYQVGFSSPNYFYKCFKEQYGMTVKEYLRT